MFASRILILLCFFKYSASEVFLSLTSANLNPRVSINESDIDGQDVVSRFPCVKYSSPPRDITVHSLSPMDVSVIAALGDSITAGFGITAHSAFGFRDDRGMSFSGGGDGTIKRLISLPNILKIYNPKLKGYATGHGTAGNKNAHFNVAQSGAISAWMPGQATKLIGRMKDRSYGIDYENDWKVITLFVGGNDLCFYCNHKFMFSAKHYVSNIRKALDILHQEVPKAFVNVIEMIDLTQYQTMEDIKKCNFSLHLSCECMLNAITPVKRAEINEVTRRYQRGLKDLVNTGRYDTRKDFTVVVQPFFSETVFRKKDNRTIMSYFAYDCFHLSKKGHELAAESLWINMNQPVGRKRLVMSEDIICPSADQPYFYTRKNSRLLTGMAASFPEAKVLPSKIPNHSKVKEQSEIYSSPTHNTRLIMTLTLVGIVVVVAILSTTMYYMKKQKKNIESTLLLIDKNIMNENRKYRSTEKPKHGQNTFFHI